ncbi:MAG: hypothetical protein JWO95_3718 [Verrucomicrobiales bacterium]|nr:hypothetical protein [Verrucomicrobiales bacterium]
MLAVLRVTFDKRLRLLREQIRRDEVTRPTGRVETQKTPMFTALGTTGRVQRGGSLGGLYLVQSFSKVCCGSPPPARSAFVVGVRQEKDCSGEESESQCSTKPFPEGEMPEYRVTKGLAEFFGPNLSAVLPQQLQRGKRDEA